MANPPVLNDIEAERALIGAVLLQPEAVHEIEVKPSDFYRDTHKWIYQALLDISGDGNRPDYIAVGSRLGDEKLKQAGGHEYLIGLINDCPNSTNYQEYALQVTTKAKKREALERASKIANLAANPDTAPETLAEAFRLHADAFTEHISTGKTQTELEKRFTVHTAGYALQPRPPVKFIVDNLIRPKSVSCFFGESGSKKSYSIIDMAVCVAAGKPWLGFATEQQNVLYIDEETNEDEFSGRLAEVLRGEYCDENTPVCFVSLSGLLLDNHTDLTFLELLIEQQHAGLVILDALTDIMTGDENSKQDTQPIFTALKQIAVRTDAAIIVIHHAGKSGDYRGSSAIKGAVDLLIKVESEHGKNVINFKSEKVRYGEATSWAAVSAWVDDSFVLRRAEFEETPYFGKSERYVLEYLEEHGATSITDLEGAADICSGRAAKNAVYSLAAKGKITRTNPDERGRGVSAIYELVKQ